MKRILFIIILIFSVAATKAQQFIDKAVIEYEVKTNIKKTIGNSSFAEMLKDQMPDFKTGYYTYTFADNKSIYKFDHWSEKAKVPQFLRQGDEENVWCFDFTAAKMNMQKDIYGSKFNVEDSLPVIKWKLTNENREIAGFNCRKAVGVIMDSVYVFAFYTDEITIPGGPCSISGLPGMILGLTIPRMYTSYIATKLTLSGVIENNIKPVAAKKYYTNITLKSTINERIKEWFSGDDEENKKYKDQFIWNILL